MSERGVFAVNRAIFDHPAFAPEPFTEREAWTWLIGSAAWQPMRIRVAHKIYALDRGQLVFSERFLAEKWQWTKSRVHRFLFRLKIEAMIELRADHGSNHITICNYNKYQFGRTSHGTQIEPPNEPVADQPRTKEEELNNYKKEDREIRAPAISPEAFALADSLVSAIKSERDLPQWHGLPWSAQCWLAEKIPKEFILATATRISPTKPLRYFDRAIRNSWAERQIEGTTNAQIAGNQAGNVVAAADRLAARLAEFDKPAPEPDLRGGTGAAHVRMLSKG